MKLRLVMCVLVLVVVLAACATPTSQPTAPATAVSRPTVPPAAGPSAGQLAALGKAAFVGSCACHGANGEGRNAPAVVGASAKLQKYGTAQALLDFVTRSMPLGKGGSLTADVYQQILSFILVDNKLVSADSAFNSAGLSGISLSK